MIADKKLKQKIATCLINNELGFVGKDWFSAGVKLPRNHMLDGLADFVVGMVAREEDKNCKAELKKGILVYLKKRKEE